MSNLFAGINLALNAIMAHQQSMQVIEHNVANANTPGYHRQEAVLTAGIPYPAAGMSRGIMPGQMGSGINVDRIRRFNIDYFDGRFRRELGESKRWTTQSEVLSQVEAAMAETSSDGLTTKLDAFWKGWQSLSSDPANQAYRSDLLARSKDLTDGFNSRAEGLMAIRKDQDMGVKQRVEEVNNLASQVARINTEIATVKSVGDQPNDLYDKRDAMIDRLAELTGAVSTVQENGEAIVSVSGHVLVVGSSTSTLTAAANPANDNLVDVSWNDGQAFTAPSGEMAGLLIARDQTIPGQLNNLNTLALEISNQVNTVHRAGFGLNNSTNVNFFEPFTTTNYALEFRLGSQMSDINNIAAATAIDSPGDGNQATKMADLRMATVMNGNTSTINQYLIRSVADLGIAINTANTRARDRDFVMKSLQTIDEATSGVSLDEEAANLVKSQRAFQAAQQLMTAFDDMLNRVINGLGTGGR